MRKTLWYRNGSGRHFHVEAGSAAELQLRKDGAQVVADPTDPDAPAPETETQSAGGTPAADDLTKKPFTELKAMAIAKGLEFRVGMSTADLVAFLETGTAGTPGDGK